MRRHAWETTPVGPVAHWPFSLKLAVRTLLDCQLPMYLAWGDAYTQFFNDAYVPILGAKKDGALGGDVRATWPEIWPVIGPMWAGVLQGEPVGSSDLALTINRYGYFETCHFAYSYSPVCGDDGSPKGVLVTFVETTETVQAERRRAFQLELADILRRETSSGPLLRAALRQVGAYVDDATVTYAETRPGAAAAVILEQWDGGTRTPQSASSGPR